MIVGSSVQALRKKIVVFYFKLYLVPRTCLYDVISVYLFNTIASLRSNLRTNPNLSSDPLGVLHCNMLLLAHEFIDQLSVKYIKYL